MNQEVKTINGYSVKDEKAVRTYDTVALMKADTKLKEGYYVKTKGYYTAGDGGHGEYLIVNDEELTEDNGSVHILTNGLRAKLIENNINLKQFGAVGDGFIDDTISINKAVLYARNNNSKLYAQSQDIYLISEPIDISNIECNFNMATFITNSEIDGLIEIDSDTYLTFIDNVTLDCNNKSTSGLLITNGRKVNINNIVIKNIKTYGINYLSGYEVIVNKAHLIGYGNSDSIGIRCLSSDSHFTDIVLIDLRTGIYNKSINIFDKIHGWIYKPELIYQSKFIHADGGITNITNSISDTYYYTIYEDSYPKIFATNLIVEYNSEIMTDESLLNSLPLLYYLTHDNADNRFKFVNCFFRGILTKTIGMKISNHEDDYINAHFVVCEFNNTSKTYAYINDWINSSNKGDIDTIYEDTLTMKNGNRQIKFQFSYDWNNGRDFNLPSLPIYYRPITDITTIATYGTSRWDIDGVCYLYIGAGGSVNIKLPQSVTSGNTPIYITGIVDIITKNDI